MRCLVIAAGNVNSQWLRQIARHDDTVICADRGARYARAAGITPAMIVGDFDSLTSTEKSQYAREGITLKEHPPAKDDTDTALAFQEALALRPEEILIAGALGTRFDHSLANVHLLRTGFAHGVKTKIVDEFNEISLVAPPEPVIITGSPGDEFSLLPLTSEVKGVYVKGARWELENACFSIGNPYGISNQLAAEKAHISITAGLMLLIRVFQEKEDEINA